METTTFGLQSCQLSLILQKGFLKKKKKKKSVHVLMNNFERFFPVMLNVILKISLIVNLPDCRIQKEMLAALGLIWSPPWIMELPREQHNYSLGIHC